MLYIVSLGITPYANLYAHNFGYDYCGYHYGYDQLLLVIAMFVTVTVIMIRAVIVVIMMLMMLRLWPTSIVIPKCDHHDNAPIISF